MARKRRNLPAMLLVLSILMLVPCGLSVAGSWVGAETPLPEPDITLFQGPALEQAEPLPAAVLRQAASLCKKVLFLDDRAEGEFSELKSTLAALGFEVQELLPAAITPSLIAPYDVVVFSLGWYAGGGGQREITDAEAAAVVQYVNSGKSLFLVGELGRASWSGKWRKSLNRIAVNFGVTFDNNMLCSAASHLSDPADPDGGVDLPIIKNISSSLLKEGVGQFSLFWGSTVHAEPPARIVARTDAGSWRDIDCTWNFVINEWECEQDPYEPSGARPVMALAESGAGRLLAIGDSSWLMNGWIDYTDNLQLAKNVFAWLARLPAVKSLTAKPTTGTRPLAVEFTCTLKDPGTRVAAVRWDFGDGTTVTNTLIGENVRAIPQGHVYPNQGTYAATCTVVDKGGCSGTSQPSVITVANPTHVTIGGRVTDSEGRGIGNVIMTGLPGNPATDVNGNYTATVVYGWSGTVTPTLAGRTFTPPTRTYQNVTANLTGQNYTGALINLTIAGQVSNDSGAAISGVTMTGLPGNPATDVNGNYTATVVYGWSGTVTPTLAGRTFTPPTRTYQNVTSNLTGQNYTGALINLTIAGQIGNATGAGISGVTMTGLPGSPVTDGNGNYTATVTYGWSGTVTPTLAGWTFTPPSRTYSNVTANQTGQDYTGALINLTIAGRVMHVGGQGGIAGVTMSGLPGSPTTDTDGNYTATVTYGWSGTVTPTLAGWSFTPPSRTYSNVTANQTVQGYSGTLITLTISGQVTDSAGAAVSNVTMAGLPGSPTTDTKGNYTATVTYGWSGTVTPTQGEQSFVPQSRSYSNVTSNQTGQDYTRTIYLSIEGYVVNSAETGISGVAMIGLPGTPITNAGGFYYATVTYGWSGTVTPTLNGHSFTPANRSYTNVTSDWYSQSYTIANVTISGRISGDILDDPPDIAISMVGFPTAVSTDDNGNYSGAVPYGWTGTITPTQLGYTFTPPSRSYNEAVTSNRSGEDYTFPDIL